MTRPNNLCSARGTAALQLSADCSMRSIAIAAPDSPRMIRRPRTGESRTGGLATSQGSSRDGSQSPRDGRSSPRPQSGPWESLAEDASFKEPSTILSWRKWDEMSDWRLVLGDGRELHVHTPSAHILLASSVEPWSCRAHPLSHIPELNCLRSGRHGTEVLGGAAHADLTMAAGRAARDQAA